MKIVALVGLTGSGKSEAASVFEQTGFSKIRFGDITEDEIRKRGLEVNERNERLIRERLRHEFGMGAYAKLNIPKIDDLVNEGKDIILDGLYSWEEYLELKKRYGKDIIMLAIYAPPEKRYQRLSIRKVRPLTKDEGQSRDRAEIENLNKAGPIAMADHTILNTGTLDQLKDTVRDYISQL